MGHVITDDLGKFFDIQGGKISLPKTLIEAVQKAQVFSSENQEEDLVEITLKAGKVKVKALGVNGWYTGTSKIVYDGEPIQFLINPDMLEEIIKRFDSCVVNDRHLAVDGGKWKYLTCLAQVKEESNG